MTLPDYIPNPGSDEALERGCKCPVLDNHHGRGHLVGGDFVIVPSCPLHGTDADTDDSMTTHTETDDTDTEADVTAAVHTLADAAYCLRGFPAMAIEPSSYDAIADAIGDLKMVAADVSEPTYDDYDPQTPDPVGTNATGTARLAQAIELLEAVPIGPLLASDHEMIYHHYQTLHDLQLEVGDGDDPLADYDTRVDVSGDEGADAEYVEWDDIDGVPVQSAEEDAPAHVADLTGIVGDDSGDVNEMAITAHGTLAAIEEDGWKVRAAVDVLRAVPEHGDPQSFADASYIHGHRNRYISAGKDESDTRRALEVLDKHGLVVSDVDHPGGHEFVAAEGETAENPAYGRTELGDCAIDIHHPTDP